MTKTGILTQTNIFQNLDQSFFVPKPNQQPFILAIGLFSDAHYCHGPGITVVPLMVVKFTLDCNLA